MKGLCFFFFVGFFFASKLCLLIFSSVASLLSTLLTISTQRTLLAILHLLFTIYIHSAMIPYIIVNHMPNAHVYIHIMHAWNIHIII